MDRQELLDRTKKFALRTIKLVRALPKNMEGNNVGNQLFRSSTSVAANYRAACRARSKVEFISKLGIVIEEIDESGVLVKFDSGNGVVEKNIGFQLVE